MHTIQERTESENHRKQATYGNFMPSLSVDCAIFGLVDKKLKVLLVKHTEGESAGRLALPGGWIDTSESLEDSAKRILADSTSAENVYIEQLRAFSDCERSGSQRVITFAFYALLPPKWHKATSEISHIRSYWQDVSSLPPLIFDHNEIVSLATENLRRRVRYDPIGTKLLPEKFTLGQLQDLYEAVLEVKLDKPNFRRKMLRMNFLEKCNETQDKVPHRAGALFRFDQEKFDELCSNGFSFEF